MSGLLGRLAARAVGGTPAARPRAPSPFPAEPGAELVEISGEAPATAPTPHAGAPVGGRPAAARHGDFVLKQHEVGARPTHHERQQQASVPTPAVRAALGSSDRETPGPRASATPSLSPAAPPAPPAERGRRGPAGPPGETLVLHRHERQVVAAVPAAVGAPAVPAAVPAPRDPARPAREEPPPVRVHIGRLEVRAAQPEPAREPARREPPATLSLGDYLRGRREASS